MSLFLEVARQLLQIEKIEASILQKSATVKPAEMTFLEKSASRQSKMSFFGGSVRVPLFEFLIAIRKAFRQWFNTEGYHLDPSSLFVVQEMLNLWRDLVQLSSTTKLNESIFQVYLSLIEEWVRTAAKCLPNGYITAVETALQAFKTPLQLSTGLSMERIWAALRPSVPHTLQSWDQYILLKSIMKRFDLVGVEGE
jgi:midasin (ATPase involved in ribosome maturation)